jgi:Cu+-exporting ATPase
MVEFRVEGMDCVNCALGIERHLSKVGISEVTVNFATAKVRARIHTEQQLDHVISEVRKLGYRPVDATTPQTKPGLFQTTTEQKLLVATIFTAPLVAHMFFSYHLLHNPYLQLLLCLPVYLLGSLHFGRSAIASLRARLPNMDALIFIGVNAAFFYSLVGTALGLGDQYLFYETAATITTFVLLGNVLEQRAVKRTTSAVEELALLQPTTAKQIVIENGIERVQTIDSATIGQGDLLVAHLGDRIAADGVVVSGSAAVDESMISGESVPVDKEEGSQVVGGTIIASGSLRYSASAVGDATVLAGIIRLVEETRTHKPQIQRLGDIVSGWFVPTVIVIALGTFIVSLVVGVGIQNSLLRAIAVLVISCPCAMGLATPTAVMVGIGRAARKGILMKGGGTIERLAKIQTVAFDKTGTLTTGNFSITSIHPAKGVSEETVRSIVHGLERHSSHPIALSLVRAFSDTPPTTMEEVVETRGSDIRGRDSSGNIYRLGTPTNPGLPSNGPTRSLHLLKNGELFAELDIDDEIREEATETIQRLKRMGLETALVSGDRRARCEAVAAALGIDRVYSEQRPEQKLQVIGQLGRERALAYVGDGINDAPALEAASVGISLSTATQAAIQSSQVVLLHGDLLLVPCALSLATRTYSTIKQNLFWAFFYNVAAIPAAAMGLLSPMVAALTMAFSDVIVIGNSLLLKRKSIVDEQITRRSSE